MEFTENENASMSDEEIKRIIEDPNTWDWDGCSHSDKVNQLFEENKKERDEWVKQMKAKLKSEYGID
ncbi:MAG: hypothetical protein MJ215_05850 [Spirochaetia bacterium]|nr:hypothetical protein [Spirochaetia bacterium]